MSSLKTREIRAALKKKGFSEIVSKDHIWLNYTPYGKKTSIRTKVSHGKEDIGDPLIAAMARETKLGKGEFIKLVLCTISSDQYYDIVRNNM